MIFIFKQKPVNLDCFTANSTVHKFTPIAPATSLMPEWWKKLPKSEIDNVTMKSCAGFVDLYNKNIVIPSWSEIVIDVTESGNRVRIADRGTSADTHGASVSGDLCPVTNTSHLRLSSPWVFVCKEPIYWHYSQPIWENMAKDYVIPSGVVEYQLQHTTNVNMMLRKGAREIFIEYNSPLVHITPLTERPVKIHNHLVTAQEYEALNGKVATFSKFYYKTKRAFESQCPFGGGK